MSTKEHEPVFYRYKCRDCKYAAGKFSDVFKHFHRSHNKDTKDDERVLDRKELPGFKERYNQMLPQCFEPIGDVVYVLKDDLEVQPWQTPSSFVLCFYRAFE